MTNPLLTDWNTPFGLPPFGAISDDDFAPAVDAALALSRANIAAIADDPDAPDFANTIAALEQADATLNRVLGAFYSLAGATVTRRATPCSAISRPCSAPILPRFRKTRRCSRGSRRSGPPATPSI